MKSSHHYSCLWRSPIVVNQNYISLSFQLTSSYILEEKPKLFPLAGPCSHAYYQLRKMTQSTSTFIIPMRTIGNHLLLLFLIFKLFLPKYTEWVIQWKQFICLSMLWNTFKCFHRLNPMKFFLLRSDNLCFLLYTITNISLRILLLNIIFCLIQEAKKIISEHSDSCIRGILKNYKLIFGFAFGN